MIRNLLIGAAVAALTASAALADPTITATFTGTITGGRDDAGLFGEAGADMTNATFTAVYVFHPLTGIYQSQPDYFSSAGGQLFGAGQSPLVSMQFTVNGGTIYTFDGSLGGQISAGIHETVGGYEYPAEFMTLGATFGDSFVVSIGNDVSEYADRGYGNPGMPDFDEDVSDVDGCGCGANSFQYFTLDQGFGDNLTLTNSHLTIRNEGFVAPPPPPVPEPASWALMLGGFGLVGGVLRSRRRVAVRFG